MFAITDVYASIFCDDLVRANVHLALDLSFLPCLVLSGGLHANDVSFL